MNTNPTASTTTADPRERLACPACATGFGDTLRIIPTVGGLRRERRCRACGHGWTTLEIPCTARPPVEAALIETASAHAAAALRTLNLIAGRSVKRRAMAVKPRDARRQAEAAFRPTSTNGEQG